MSTTDKLKSKVVKTNQPQAQVPAVAKKKLPPLAASILSADFRQQLALALPKTMTADRMARIVVTECNKNTQLYNCDEKSFFASVLQCAALGLEPGDGLGQCYLLPYGKKCQLIIGYRGMIDLARRSGQIRAIFAYCVHQKDHFSYTLGLDPNLEHVPCDDSDPGPTTHVYAVAKLTDGSSQFEVMSRAQVEKIRLRSKASSNGPWTTDWDEMAKKGLALDTPIPTPDGWTTMQDLQKGDVVFDMDGHQTTVTSISDIKHIRCFRVTFSNGFSVVCDDEHKWVARSKSHSHGRAVPFREMTVNEMKEAKENGLNVTIPVQKALDLPPATLPVDPYLLGYWLGDGCSRASKITCSCEDKQHVVKAIESAGYAVGKIYKDERSNAVDIGITSGFLNALKDAQLLQNKHVPAEYLRGSIEQRKALLAGLLDSDGHCSKDRGQASFCSTNKGLRDAVFELATSLGEVAHTREYLAKGFGKTSIAYTVEWRPSFNPFRLDRKAANYRPRKIAPYISVKLIEEIDSVPTKCIAVDSPTKTYLCGRNMAVTHNTVVRRLFKYLPVSTEAIRAASADEKSERGEDLDDYDILEDRYIDQGGDVPPPREKPVAEDIEPHPVQEQPEPITAQPTPIKRESPIPPAPDDPWLAGFEAAQQ